MWLGIFSIIMMFTGLTSAYIVRKGQSGWLSIEMPQIFWVSSAIILVSSVTMNMALSAIKKGNKSMLLIMILTTLGLGIGFAVCQWSGWAQLIRAGIHPVEKHNSASQYFYLLTALHLAHLAFGLLSLIFVSIKAMLRRYTAERYNGVRIAAIYWHFLDGLWIYLFLFLYFFK